MSTMSLARSSLLNTTRAARSFPAVAARSFASSASRPQAEPVQKPVHQKEFKIYRWVCIVDECYGFMLCST